MQKCKECGKALSGKKERFCSGECRKKHWQTAHKGYKVFCRYCGEGFTRKRKTAIRQTSEYCSRLCANRANGKMRVKEKTRRGKYGYVSLYAPEHPCSYGGRVREHRIVMEKKIGRYLKKNEIVHHINYLEWDNRPENLYLVSNSADHHFLHGKSRFLMKDFITERGLNEELTNYIKAKCDLFDSNTRRGSVASL